MTVPSTGSGPGEVLHLPAGYRDARGVEFALCGGYGVSFAEPGDEFVTTRVCDRCLGQRARQVPPRWPCERPGCEAPAYVMQDGVRFCLAHVLWGIDRAAASRPPRARHPSAGSGQARVALVEHDVAAARRADDLAEACARLRGAGILLRAAAHRTRPYEASLADRCDEVALDAENLLRDVAERLALSADGDSPVAGPPGGPATEGG